MTLWRHHDIMTSWLILTSWLYDVIMIMLFKIPKSNQKHNLTLPKKIINQHLQSIFSLTETYTDGRTFPTSNSTGSWEYYFINHLSSRRGAIVSFSKPSRNTSQSAQLTCGFADKRLPSSDVRCWYDDLGCSRVIEFREFLPPIFLSSYAPLL